jgi:hypothetical protein
LTLGDEGIYSHIIATHAIDFFKPDGNLIQFSSWYLEAMHKYLKKCLRWHCSWGNADQGKFSQAEI